MSMRLICAVIAIIICLLVLVGATDVEDPTLLAVAVIAVAIGLVVPN